MTDCYFCISHTFCCRYCTIVTFVSPTLFVVVIVRLLPLCLAQFWFLLLRNCNVKLLAHFQLCLLSDCYVRISCTFSFPCRPIVALESRAILVSLVTGTVTSVYYPTAQNRVRITRESSANVRCCTSDTVQLLFVSRKNLFTIGFPCCSIIK